MKEIIGKTVARIETETYTMYEKTTTELQRIIFTDGSSLSLTAVHYDMRIIAPYELVIAEYEEKR